MQDVRIDDTNIKLVSEAELNQAIKQLMLKLDGLYWLVQARIAEQDQGVQQTDQFFNCGRFKCAQYYMNALFRNHTLWFTGCYVVLILSLLLIIQSIPISFVTIQIILSLFIVSTLFSIVMMLLTSIEQVVLLIRRQARFRTITTIYVSLVGLYAITYTLYELVDPGKFSGIDSSKYNGVLSTVRMYSDFLYFSNVCQSSVGFGDIVSKSMYGRLTVMTQTLVSAGYLGVLLSNWIR